MLCTELSTSFSIDARRLRAGGEAEACACAALRWPLYTSLRVPTLLHVLHSLVLDGAEHTRHVLGVVDAARDDAVGETDRRDSGTLCSAIAVSTSRLASLPTLAPSPPSYSSAEYDEHDVFEPDLTAASPVDGGGGGDTAPVLAAVVSAPLAVPAAAILDLPSAT